MSKTRIRLKKVLGYIIMSVAALVVQCGFYFFLLPANLVTGGVMGISIILEPLIKPSYVIYGLNIIFLIMSIFFLGKNYFFKTIYLSLLAPTFVFLLDNVFQIPYDLIISKIAETPLLISAVMGGILVGAGMGIIFFYGGLSGGIDIPQKIISKYTKIPFRYVMYTIDSIIIIIAFITYITKSHYDNIFLAILSMIIAGFFIETLSLSGKSGYTYFIISTKHDLIKMAIITKLKRGATIINAKGAYTDEQRDILVCSIIKREKLAMDLLITEIDKKAFVFICETKEILGFGFSKNQDIFTQEALKDKAKVASDNFKTTDINNIHDETSKDQQV